MKNEQNELPLSLATLVMTVFVSIDGITTFLGMVKAIEAKDWMQYLFVIFVALSTMLYVVCLRWVKQQFLGTTGYLGLGINLSTPVLFLLFFVIDVWSSFESLNKYVIKDINFEENLLALLILFAGTLVCASAPILLAFYNEIKEKLI